MKIRTLYTGLLMTLLAGISLAQGDTPKPAPPPPAPTVRFYRLDFVVKELEGGKVLNSRMYSTTMSGDQRPAGIRTGSRVPVSGGAKDFQYIDVGVNIDCSRMREVGNQLALNVGAEVSMIADDYAGPHAPGQPVIRENRWNSDVLVPLRKATTLFSSDDATSKRQIQLDLTATPLP